MSNNILVVEDNEITKLGLKDILENDGYIVSTADDGVMALEVVKKNLPDLILCDISMPEMDGFEFYDIVRKNEKWTKVPFIFLTARGEPDQIHRGKKLGVEDYLVKPIGRKELIEIIKSRIERSQQLQYIQLKESYQASMIMLANAIELRDEYTRGHVERVMDYALMIGQQVKGNSLDRENLKNSGILHDIGKIYIPESILRKRTKCTPEEWAEIEKHPVLGADLIKNIPYLAGAELGIRHHHERWDGYGYPDQISGEQIPLEARIITIADAIDAMRSDRPYRKALTLKETQQEISRGAGSRYDPNIVEAVFDIWDDILARMDE